jgi:hypothetical protein
MDSSGLRRVWSLPACGLRRSGKPGGQASKYARTALGHSAMPLPVRRPRLKIRTSSPTFRQASRPVGKSGIGRHRHDNSVGGVCRDGPHGRIDVVRCLRLFAFARDTVFTPRLGAGRKGSFSTVVPPPAAARARPWFLRRVCCGSARPLRIGPQNPGPSACPGRSRSRLPWS